MLILISFVSEGPIQSDVATLQTRGSFLFEFTLQNQAIWFPRKAVPLYYGRNATLYGVFS